MAGQLSFKTNCTGPGSLSGDNPSDNSGQAGFFVSITTPVTLADFNASLINCEPSLNWSTQTEFNTDRFEIERKLSAFSNWLTAGTVSANGNSTQSNKYRFTDINVPVTTTKVFYRLKIIDRDGHFKYSAVLPVSINCKVVQVAVYPNPVMDNNLFVSITGINGSAEAILLSLAGQAILKTNLTNGTATISTAKIATGVYVLSVTDLQGTNRKVKVLIQH
jgi:hypothetical protein